MGKVKLAFNGKLSEEQMKCVREDISRLVWGVHPNQAWLEVNKVNKKSYAIYPRAQRVSYDFVFSDECGFYESDNVENIFREIFSDSPLVMFERDGEEPRLYGFYNLPECFVNFLFEDSIPEKSRNGVRGYFEKILCRVEPRETVLRVYGLNIPGYGVVPENAARVIYRLNDVSRLKSIECTFENDNQKIFDQTNPDQTLILNTRNSR